MRSLSTVNEHRFRIIDWQVEGHDCCGVGRNGYEALVDASCTRIRVLDRLAWLGECGLCNGVVDLVELKLQDVPR